MQDQIAKFIQDNFGKSLKRNFTSEEKQQLKPIAEVLAILDGNAFFGLTTDDNGEDTWYENYLPEAWQIFKFMGKDKGWISQTSWMKALEHENESVLQAYEHWRLLKKISKR